MYIFLILLFTSVDTLLVSITYYNSSIKIPIKSILSICITNIIIILLIYMLNNYINITDKFVSNILSFILLTILGLYNIFNEYIKNKLNNNNKLAKIFKNKLNADTDQSKILNISESIYLGIILSIDTIIGGLGIMLNNVSIYMLCIISFLINFLLIYLGKFVHKIRFNFNSDIVIGIIIIIIAFIKFIFNIYV